MKLVVVESPAKVKKISAFLGSNYKVMASFGHVVDLPKKEFGIEFENGVKPKYIVINKKAISALKKAFENCDGLIIASDPDREGEAIGWHIANKLVKKSEYSKVQRISFTSITKDAVLEAIKNPRKLDENLINAQQTRRILDRIVGYKLSPLLWEKLQRGLSAGRVQSVAVRLIVDREEERMNFKSKEYWKVFSWLFENKKECQISFIKSNEAKKEDQKEQGTKFELTKRDEKKIEIATESECKEILSNICGKKWIVESVKETVTKRNPQPPFKTSTIQQAASNKFGYSPSKTMKILQSLYEAGLISYMRTDSLNIASSEVEKIRTFIKSSFGKKYLSQKTRAYVSKSVNLQEAHEAIRPTDISKNSKLLNLKNEEAKIYDLIWMRTVASQMESAVIKNKKVVVKVDNLSFESAGVSIVFDGFLKIYSNFVDEVILPDFKVGQELFAGKIKAFQLFTQPPARYTEATLIKALEKFGIGRPSTYAPIISTIILRKYVEKENKYLKPTDIAFSVVNLLKKYFKKIVDVDFTSKMEEDLDEIADARKDWQNVILDFNNSFMKEIDNARAVIKSDEFRVLGESSFKCPDCGGKMVKKIGRFGSFLSCANYPDCKGIRSVDGKSDEQQKEEVNKVVASNDFIQKYESAPKSKDGSVMILKEGKYGKFWAHKDYPSVKEFKPLLLKEKCPNCGKNLLERKGKWGKSFVGCSGYPDCRFIKK